MTTKRQRRLPPSAVQALEGVERAIEDSKQPRFGKRPDPGAFYSSVYKWVDGAGENEPPYAADSRSRDTWLREFARLEPHLTGVLNSVIAIDKNRGWSLTGGRNQVYRYTPVLHNWAVAPGLYGWRAGASAAAMSYYGADIGSIIEVGREGKAGPMRALYHVDPARCRLTADGDLPLRYKAGVASPEQAWPRDGFFRIASMPSTDESLYGLGLCAVSRCVELAKILIAVYRHDQEMLGARAPRGLLLLHGIREDQWESAMQAREAKLDSLERRYYGAVAVLATSGTEEISAQLVALSQLPAGFDQKTFTDLTMYGYALAFGYDPREFWPVSGGALGTATETETQHNKATGKGGLDFALSFQEQLQEELPETLQFEFDQRDDAGELAGEAVRQAKSKTILDVYSLTAALGEPVITREEARMLLAESGLIPHEWTEAEEEIEATDIDAERARALENGRVRRAIEAAPDEPILRYSWPSGRARVLFERGGDALVRRSYPVAKHRADKDVLYDKNGVVITMADVKSAIKNGKKRLGEEYSQLLEGKAVEE